MNRFTVFASAVMLAAAGLASTAVAAPKTFQFDRAHSEVGFNIRHFFNKTHGRFDDYTGKIVFDPENLVASSVEVTIRDSSINTANERRDNDLRGENFFWTEKYPQVTFKSTKVIPGATKEKFQVAGDLTIRDVTKPVVLDVEYLGSGAIVLAESDGNKRPLGTQAGFQARTTINRKDYGIVWNRSIDQGGVMLGEDVEIVLSVAAVNRDGMQAQNAPPKQPPADPKQQTTASEDKK